MKLLQAEVAASTGYQTLCINMKADARLLCSALYIDFFFYFVLPLWIRQGEYFSVIPAKNHIISVEEILF